MRNCYLKSHTAADIDRQIAKVLRGLDNPEPPLRLEFVIELLNLDRQFYTSADDGVLSETISRIKVGTLQVFKRPTLLAEAIRKLDLKALYIPDRKRILIDENVPKAKIRHLSAHEITHDLCMEWHQHALFGDSETTVSQECHDQIEREANYGAGRLLTLQDHFKDHVCGQELTLKKIGAVGKTFGNTWTSTLWRTVESLDIPAFAVIGPHPHRSEVEEIRYFIRSRRFLQEFSNFDEQKLFNLIKSYCGFGKLGPMGQTEARIYDDRGESYVFHFETFATPYDVMTLGQRVRQ